MYNYNKENEKKAIAEGFDFNTLTKEAKPYVEIIHEVAKGMREGDEFVFDFMASVDREKHQAHNALCSAVERTEAELKKQGFDPVYEGLVDGKVANRVEAARFVMTFMGYGEDAEYAQ